MQSEAGDITPLFDDESEAQTHPHLAHTWAKRGTGPRGEAGLDRPRGDRRAKDGPLGRRYLLHEHALKNSGGATRWPAARHSDRGGSGAPAQSRLRRSAAMPSSPAPSKARLIGSETGVRVGSGVDGGRGAAV